jgi:hypothetical protein
MKPITISLEPKELEVLKDMLKYEIETRGLDLCNNFNTHPEDLLWMTENAHKAASLLHKIHIASTKKKGKK